MNLSTYHATWLRRNPIEFYYQCKHIEVWFNIYACLPELQPRLHPLESDLRRIISITGMCAKPNATVYLAKSPKQQDSEPPDDDDALMNTPHMC